eukprot:57684-Hanusia_phi.AAC.1
MGADDTDPVAPHHGIHGEGGGRREREGEGGRGREREAKGVGDADEDEARLRMRPAVGETRTWVDMVSLLWELVRGSRGGGESSEHV